MAANAYFYELFITFWICQLLTLLAFAYNYGVIYMYTRMSMTTYAPSMINAYLTMNGEALKTLRVGWYLIGYLLFC